MKHVMIVIYMWVMVLVALVQKLMEMLHVSVMMEAETTNLSTRKCTVCSFEAAGRRITTITM